MTLEYETDTYEDLAQDFFHPRAHALGPSGVRMVGGIEVVLIHHIHTRNIPEG